MMTCIPRCTSHQTCTSKMAKNNFKVKHILEFQGTGSDMKKKKSTEGLNKRLELAAEKIRNLKSG